MRYIDIDLLLEDPEAQNLIAAADAAREAIINAPDKKTRDDLIKQSAKIWVAFRPHIERIFGPKCWYTESINPGTDNDIDHFRPKGKVAEDVAHEGYWWEALNWRNFRLSCQLANRPRTHPVTGQTHGKHEHFPIFDSSSSPRWSGPTLICRERPKLLDPTDPADPPLLTFDPDGFVQLSPLYEGQQEALERFEVSRKYLNLDWPPIKEGRRDLYITILKKVTEGDNASHLFSLGELAARDSLKSVSKDLIRMAKDDAVYSRAAHAYLAILGERDWLKMNVLPHIPALRETGHA